MPQQQQTPARQQQTPQQHQQEQDEDPRRQQEKINHALRNWKYGGNWKYAKNDQTGEIMMFCWIPKIGCTRFKALFSNLYTSPFNYEMRWQKGETIPTLMHNPNVKKVMFYREPLERFLSGYLEKCTHTTRVYCVRVFGDDDVSFREAVFQLPTYNVDKMDGHFHPQTRHCGGLTRDVLDTVFDSTAQLVDEPSTRQATQQMFQQVFSQLTQEQFDRIYPPGKSNHASDASTKLEQYYNDPQLVGIVVQFFLEDYIAFDMKVPDFAQEALLELRTTQDPYALSDDNMKRLGIPLLPLQQQEKERANTIVGAVKLRLDNNPHLNNNNLPYSFHGSTNTGADNIITTDLQFDDYYYHPSSPALFYLLFVMLAMVTPFIRQAKTGRFLIGIMIIRLLWLL